MHTDVDKDKADYKGMKRICLQFAKMGHEERMTPRLRCKSEEYKRIYAPLIGTKYLRPVKLKRIQLLQILQQLP